jgi:hypothetical protein
MKDSPRESASPAPEQKAQEREGIAARFEDVLETLNSDTDVFDFMRHRDGSRGKYQRARESGRELLGLIVQTIRSMRAFKNIEVTEYLVPQIIRENGFVANLVKGSLEKLETISQSIHEIIEEVRARCEAALGDMDPPEIIMPDYGEDELIVRDTVKGHQTTETEQEF